MKKRIIFVGPSANGGAPQHPGGQLTAANGIAEYARTHGYELHVTNTLIHNFPPPSMGRKIRLGGRRVFLFVRELASTKIDGVILFVGSRHSFFERIVLTALARARGARTLFCIRDGAFVEWMLCSGLNRVLVPLLLRIPDRIVLQGSRFEVALEDAGVPREKLVVVPNWLPAHFEIAAEPRTAEVGSPLRLVFVGWLVKEKGVRELLDAFIDLSARHLVTLDIIGGGTLELELRARISSLGLRGVSIHGWTSSGEIKRYLTSAHVFVLPTYFEGFPNALLEAMACGLPAISTDVGAIAGSIEHGVNGYLVPSRDSVGLAEAVENYLEKPGLVEAHSRATLAKVTAVHDRETNLAKLFEFLG